MVDTFTPFLDLIKPEIGGSPNTWGNKLNGNQDLIDTEFGLFFEGDPNGWMAGYLGRRIYDSTNGLVWVCITAGDTETAVWKVSGGGVFAALDAVDTEHIEDDAITNAKLADEAVTGSKIVDEEITLAKLHAELQSLVTAPGVPTGVTADFAGSTAPDGWLLCHGQAISRSTFSALFEAIGTTYGAGNGTSTFNVPDIRGRVVAGRDNMGDTAANRLDSATVLGNAQGSKEHALTSAQMPSHFHGSGTLSAASHNHSYDRGSGVFVQGGADVSVRRQSSSSSNTGSSGSLNVSGSTSTTGGGDAHPNVQPTIIMNKIIKT